MSGFVGEKVEGDINAPAVETSELDSFEIKFSTKRNGEAQEVVRRAAAKVADTIRQRVKKVISEL